MKKTRKIGVVLAFVLALVVGVASVAPAAIEVEGDAYIGIFDKYLWRGFDLSGGNAVVQGGMDLYVGGFTLGYWSNLQLSSDADAGTSSGDMDETDFFIDYSFDLSEMVWGSVGNVLYAIDGGKDTNEAYLAVGLNTLLNPSLTIYWDWVTADEDGLYYVLAIGHDIEVNDALTLSLTASAGYNQDSDWLIGSYSDFHNAEFGVSAEYALTEAISLSPTFIYSTPISDDAEDIGGIDDEISFGLTATFSF